MGVGVFYAAFGDQWVAEAVQSASSLKEYNDVPITLYTDRRVANAAFDRVEVVALEGDQRVESIRLRIGLMAESPYDRVLRLDTDTLVLGSLAPVFDLLDHFDVASRHAPIRISLPQPGDDVPESFPEYCAGIVALKRSSRAAKFVEMWGSKFRELVAWAERQERLPPGICPYHADNASLRWALYHSGMRLATLTEEWLCTPGAGYASGEVKLVHARGEMLERAKRQINERLGARVYLTGGLI